MSRVKLFAGLAAGLAFMITHCVGAESEKLIGKIEYPAKAETVAAQAPAKLLQAKETAAPPKIDGVLDDECWKSAAPASNYILFQSEGKPPTAGTTTKVVFTKDHIYFGVVCEEPNMGQLVQNCAKRDGSVWYDDCVEIWLDPNCDRFHSYHFLVNPIGTLNDYREWDDEISDPLAIKAGEKKIVHYDDAKWDCACEVKAAKGEKSWTVELAIPAAGMGVEEVISGSQWGFNLARTRRCGGSGELSSWTGVFVTPISRFGTLQMGAPELAINVLSMGNLSQGENTAALKVSNLTDKDKKLDVILECAVGKSTKDQKQLTLAARESKEVRLAYTFDPGVVEYTLTLGVSDTQSGKKVFRRVQSGKVPELLQLKLITTELYLKELKDIKGSLAVNLGDQTLAKAGLVFELVNERNEVLAQKTVAKIQQTACAIVFNITSIKKEGAYKLRARLMDDQKRELAKQEALFNVIESPF